MVICVGVAVMEFCRKLVGEIMVEGSRAVMVRFDEMCKSDGQKVVVERR